MAFVKMFSSMLDSTVWQEPDHTRLVWVALCLMADRDGEIAASIPGVASRAKVPLASAEIALATFLSPDRYSRTKDYGGRRIEEIDGGWKLLNYFKYRETLDQDEVRAKTAIRVRRFRDRKAKRNADNVTVTPVTPSNDIEEAEGEEESSIQGVVVLPVARIIERTEHLIKKEKRKAGDFVSPAQATAFAEFWSEYPLKKAKPNAQKAYVKAILTVKQHAAVMGGLRAQLPGMIAEEPRHRPHPASWINARRWEDEIDSIVETEDQRLDRAVKELGL